MASPTLADWKKALATNQRNSRIVFEKGLNISFGTDSGAVPTRVLGVAEHHELELLVQAGFTPLEAITLATGRAAAALKLNDRGVLAVGKRADMVLLDGNPLEHISATRQIRSVWKAGVALAV